MTKALLLNLALALATTTAAEAGVYIDFNSTDSAADGTTSFNGNAWNNVFISSQPVAAAVPLQDHTSASSGLTLRISNAATTGSSVGGGFLKVSGAPNGLATSAGQALARNYPSSATKDFLFGSEFSDGGTYSSPTKTVTLTLAGFTEGEAYRFYGLASRAGLSGSRQGQITFTGENTTSVVTDGLNTSGNVFDSGVIVAPAGGVITLSLNSPSNLSSNTPARFFYLNVLEIQAVPEPASLGLAGLAGVALLRRRRA